jgi:hypothetical protein
MTGTALEAQAFMRIILKCIIKNKTGFIWLNIGTPVNTAINLQVSCMPGISQVTDRRFRLYQLQRLVSTE